MDQYGHNHSIAAMAGSFLLIGVFSLVAIAFTIVMQWRIATKAGYPGALSLLMLVPLVNFVVLILFAFTEWPIERALRAAGGGAYPGPGTYVPPGGGGYAPPTGPPATTYPPTPTASTWTPPRPAEPPPPEQLPPSI